MDDYLENGADALQRLSDFFVCAFYDPAEQRLSVASDHFGFFTVYTARRGSRIWISNSAMALAKAIGARFDPLAVHVKLMTNALFGNLTLWQDVRRVLPGQ